MPVPVKVSELENDSGYQTEEQLAEKLKSVESDVSEVRIAVSDMEKRLDSLVDGNEVEF